jgi:hypothetical protein
MLEQRGQLPIPGRVDGLEVRDDREGARRPRRQQRSRQDEGEQNAMEPSGSLCHLKSNCKVLAARTSAAESPGLPVDPVDRHSYRR